jgi:UDP-N-acetylglucosamine/UDP-N-acetylgalactosamine diphosphorylase
MTNDRVTGERRESLLSRLKPIGQQHLLAFWDELSGPDREGLARQIESLDSELFARLRKEHQRQATAADAPSPWAALAARAEPPHAMRLDGSGVPFSIDDARETGEAALRAGQVGMILVAGGLGTRLGFDQPKGMFRIGPLSGRSLFQVLNEQLLAAARRHGAAIPLYVMTSPATDEVTRAYLREHDNFGLAGEDLHIFCQATMWAVDDKFERILLESPGSLFLGPDGHGGMLAALQASGGLAAVQQRGIKHLFYGQIDNPLTQVCDELLIGSHILARSEMTTQVVRKRDPLERVGNVVSIDGRTQVIEYSDLPPESARQTNADGSLKLWAGNLAVHVFDVDFLRRSASEPGALPFHCAKKKVACLDARGQLVEPERPNALRFERFIFDLLPRAARALVVEADPFYAFAPVKNSDDEPTDNPRTARAAMIALALDQLGRAGIEVSPGVAVEINPLWASTAQEIRARLPPGTFITQPTYFAPDGPRFIV